MVHTEVVLEGDCSKGLCCSLNLHTFLGFHSLMETVAPAASFHNTSCLLVHNLHFTVHNNVVVIADEHCVGFEELLHGVYAL